MTELAGSRALSREDFRRLLQLCGFRLIRRTRPYLSVPTTPPPQQAPGVQPWSRPSEMLTALHPRMAVQASFPPITTSLSAPPT